MAEGLGAGIGLALGVAEELGAGIGLALGVAAALETGVALGFEEAETGDPAEFAVGEGDGMARLPPRSRRISQPATKANMAVMEAGSNLERMVGD